MRRGGGEGGRALVAYRDNPRLLRTLGPDSFEAGVATRQRTVERALLELAQARRAVQGPSFDPGELEARWSGLRLERALRSRR